LNIPQVEIPTTATVQKVQSPFLKQRNPEALDFRVIFRVLILKKSYDRRVAPARRRENPRVQRKQQEKQPLMNITPLPILIF